MKPIGGFFELEKGTSHGNYHTGSWALSSGRGCIHQIIQLLHPTKVWVPYYTCDTVLDPFELHNIPYDFYTINQELEIVDSFDLQDSEYILYINYFGLKTAYTLKLEMEFGSQLIIDNTQAYFNRGMNQSFSFTSVRKTLGVPDGAYLYTPGYQPGTGQFERNSDFQFDHLINRITGKQELAFNQFKSSERSVDCSIRMISKFSERILKAVDHESVKERRISNFNWYEQHLRFINRLEIPLLEGDVPFAYPLLLDNDFDKNLFFEAGFFIPTLWHDVVERNADSFKWEETFSNRLLPLPLDHRYNEEDLNRIIDFILELTGEKEND